MTLSRSCPGWADKNFGSISTIRSNINEIYEMVLITCLINFNAKTLTLCHGCEGKTNERTKKRKLSTPSTHIWGIIRACVEHFFLNMLETMILTKHCHFYKIL